VLRENNITEAAESHIKLHVEKKTLKKSLVKFERAILDMNNEKWKMNKLEGCLRKFCKQKKKTCKDLMSVQFESDVCSTL
jgi:hypothetical protein